MRRVSRYSLFAALLVSIPWGTASHAPMAAQNACIEQCHEDFENCEDSFPICRAERDLCIEACKGKTDKPAQLTSRLALVPGTDAGQFNLRVDGKTVGANKQDGESAGPLSLPFGLHIVSQTPGSGTDQKNYRTTLCGACQAGGGVSLPEGAGRSCSITNLRLPDPLPTPGCSSVCLNQFLQCGQKSESDAFCRDQFNRCSNNCVIGPARRLTVARFTHNFLPPAALNEEQADRIVADMSSVLRNFDGVGDIACNVAYCRSGNLRTFNVGDGAIDTKNELDEVFEVPGDVKVVREINFCDDEFKPDLIGCARGGSFIVMRVGSSNEGALWAHEFGHTVGLDHPDPADPTAVMNSGLTSSTRRVDSGECIAFHSSPFQFDRDDRTLSSGGTREIAPQDTLDEFVRRTYVHGVSYNAARRFGVAAVPRLLELLADRKEEEHWPNVVIVLGIVGDDRAVEPLVSLLEQKADAKISQTLYRAKRNSLIALGYLVHRTRNETALGYLRDSLSPDAWEKRGIAWSSPMHADADQRNQELSKQAIIALGLSGHPAADEALRGLLKPGVTSRETVFRGQVSGVVEEALKAHGRIAKQGLEAYYRTPQ